MKRYIQLELFFADLEAEMQKRAAEKYLQEQTKKKTKNTNQIIYLKS